MKTITIILAICAILLLVGLNFLGVSITSKSFFIDLFNGLLSNVLIFFLAIFVIDRLTRKIDENKLKEINATKSEFFHWNLKCFVYHMLVHLEIFKDDDYQKRLQDDPLLSMDWVMEEFKRVGLENDWTSLLYNCVSNKSDKQKYLSDLEKIFNDWTKPLSQNLKEIYPHPAPDVVEMVSNLFASSGTLNALSSIAGFAKEANKGVKDKKQQLTDKHTNLLIKIGLLNRKNNFSDTCSIILELSKRAEENQLFIK